MHCIFSGVDALAHGCPKLSGFVGKGLKALTDPALISLATYCKDLEHINFHGCSVCVFFITFYARLFDREPISVYFFFK